MYLTKNHTMNRTPFSLQEHKEPLKWDLDKVDSSGKFTESLLEKAIIKTKEKGPLSKIADMAVDLSPKKILIAVPTAKYIEVDTFKSIYDLEIPTPKGHVGYETFFQYFYGYNIEQIRNLVVSKMEYFDYLFFVDSDIVLPSDTLTKMLKHDKDIVSGVYIQRKPDVQVVELYQSNNRGGLMNIPFEKIRNPQLYEIAGCGFGCVLIKAEVLRKIEYPHFRYTMADVDTIGESEDTYFCRKAREAGFKVWVDSSIICDHIGSRVFRPTE